jgi:hypothetical protein
MKLLTTAAGLALAACLATGATAEAATKKKVERGVIVLPAGYDKKTNRASTVVLWTSNAGAGAHRAQLVTIDLDIVTPARLAAVHARIKSRLQSGELAAVRDMANDVQLEDLEALKQLVGGTSIQMLTDQHLIALFGQPGMRPGNATLVSGLNEDFQSVVGGAGGALGLMGLVAEGAAAGVSGPLLGGAFVAGVAIGTGINTLWDVTLDIATDGEVPTLGDAAYEIWCGDGADVGCGADGTTLPPDMGGGSAAHIASFYLATGLGGDVLQQQLKGLQIAGGADVGVERERADLAAWLAIDAKLGGEYIRQIQRGLDTRSGQHGIRPNVGTATGISPNQVFNYGRITPILENLRMAFQPR